TLRNLAMQGMVDSATNGQGLSIIFRLNQTEGLGCFPNKGYPCIQSRVDWWDQSYWSMNKGYRKRNSLVLNQETA
ncbi:MAG: hypothetical protein MK188_15490, partial [Gammaproteobacteria bacterium]|nr:hypothetical protein [Gammaproteobacteria bacterium]